MPQSAKSTGKMPPRAAALFFALSQGLVLPRSLVVFGARIGAPALCCRVGRCRLGKNAPFGTSKRKRGDNIEEFGILFGQHARYDTRLMARTEVWYPRSTHTAFVTWAFFGRWGPNRRSWQKTGTKSPQFADLGAKKRSGIPNPAILPVAQAARVPNPAILPEARTLKVPNPAILSAGSHREGAKPAISTFGPAPRQVCGKCDGWPLVEKVLEAVAPHPYNASLRLCAQRWIHPGAWQDGVAA